VAVRRYRGVQVVNRSADQLRVCQFRDIYISMAEHEGYIDKEKGADQGADQQ
jgi:hypothetical protein